MQKYGKIATVIILVIFLCLGSLLVFSNPSSEELEVKKLKERMQSLAISLSIPKNYKVRQFIHPEYGEFEFRFKFQKEDDWYEKAEIEVFDSDQKLMQQLKQRGFAVFENKYYITDLNFDGYRDILLLQLNKSARANHVYVAWLWNSRRKQFEKVDTEMPVNMAIDRQNKQLLSVESFGSGRAYQIYQFKDDKLYKIARVELKRLHRQEDLTKYGLLEKDVMSGEFDPWVFEESLFDAGKEISKSEIILISKKGSAKEEIYQQYYAPDSFWRLRDRRWYRSDYGDGLGIVKDGKEIRTKMDVE